MSQNILNSNIEFWVFNLVSQGAIVICLEVRHSITTNSHWLNDSQNGKVSQYYIFSFYFTYGKVDTNNSICFCWKPLTQNQCTIFHSTYCNVQNDTMGKTNDFETPPSKTPTVDANMQPHEYLFVTIAILLS